MRRIDSIHHLQKQKGKQAAKPVETEAEIPIVNKDKGKQHASPQETVQKVLRSKASPADTAQKQNEVKDKTKRYSDSQLNEAELQF
ncbi:hypothetical protein EWM64_g2599 [Hericium alpestre]|uniref:Uncharacterized protein n=1 Tax=Hericium alpestre TaxID=135208 RepID=A0A4Z0A513_9AGAM|nr:hypothetical protein EWM64_g2599 [Hericium alpestre]